MDFVVAYKTKMIALCQSEQGLAETIEHEVALAEQRVEMLTGEGVPLDDIYIDPLAFPFSTNPQSARVTLESAIIDPTDTLLYAVLKAVTLVVGKDDFCMDYIGALSESRIE